MERRAFLRGVAGAVGVAALGPPLLRLATADAAVLPGDGPYGPLQAADANGIQLPAGFRSRLVGTAGQAVPGTSYTWPAAPDGGACFPAAGGGWIYVANSEVGAAGGGASAVRFAADGSIAGAYRILGATSRNCAGGPTPWGTWLSCEENGALGRVYECDPQQAGQGSVRPLLGSFNHEAAVVDPDRGHVYLTEDDAAGRLYRFTPTTPGNLTVGSLFAAKVTGTAVTWVPTSTLVPDRSSGTTAFNGGEGAWIAAGTLWFTTKGDRRVWELDLATQQLTVLYDHAGTAGSALNAVDNITRHERSGDLYVAEDGGNMEVCLITTLDAQDVVAPFLRFVGHSSSEVTGPAFSPDGTRLYVSSQRGTDGSTGRTYEITGPFRDRSAPPTTTTTTTAPVAVTVPALADGYVRDGTSQSTSFGTAPVLEVSKAKGKGANRISYLRLDTAAATGPLASARLRLHARNSTSATATTVQVLAVASTTWSESALTWRTAPARGSLLGSFTVSSTTATWKEIDVTAYVNSQRAAGRTAVAFALVEPAHGQVVSIASREAAAGRPELRLEG